MRVDDEDALTVGYDVGLETLEAAMDCGAKLPQILNNTLRG